MHSFYVLKYIFRAFNLYIFRARFFLYFNVLNVFPEYCTRVNGTPCIFYICALQVAIYINLHKIWLQSSLSAIPWTISLAKGIQNYWLPFWRVDPPKSWVFGLLGVSFSKFFFLYLYNKNGRASFYKNVKPNHDLSISLWFYV